MGLSALETSPLMRKWRLVFLDFLRIKCEVLAFRWRILPEADTLKRFLAPECVLTFGIVHYDLTRCKGTEYLAMSRGSQEDFLPFFLGMMVMTMRRLPFIWGRDSMVPISSRALAKRSRRSSPFSLKMMVRPLNWT